MGTPSSSPCQLRLGGWLKLSRLSHYSIAKSQQPTNKSLNSKQSKLNFSKMVSTLLYHKKNCCDD